MINPDLEIDSLRRWLTDETQIEYFEIDRICDSASQEINGAILDIIADAVAEATDYASNIGANEFIDDMDVQTDGLNFQIFTRSGKTDYSIPEKEMLPHLLKNAETAKDGSRYKVIPIQGTESVAKSSFDALQQRKKNIDDARAAIKQSSNDNRSAKANEMASKFRQAVQSNLSAYKTDRHTIKTGEVTFRTASSKQDPSQNWVIKEKDRDMTFFLQEINQKIEDDIERVVVDIINQYREMF